MTYYDDLDLCLCTDSNSNSLLSLLTKAPRTCTHTDSRSSLLASPAATMHSATYTETGHKRLLVRPCLSSRLPLIPGMSMVRSPLSLSNCTNATPTDRTADTAEAAISTRAVAAAAAATAAAQYIAALR